MIDLPSFVVAQLLGALVLWAVQRTWPGQRPAATRPARPNWARALAVLGTLGGAVVVAYLARAPIPHVRALLYTAAVWSVAAALPERRG